MATLHALFIAIDEYVAPVPPLKGCVNDAEAFQAFLQNHSRANALDFNPKFIQNEEATRQAIVNAFDHFRDAKDGDACVFAFYGHGAQMRALPEFYDEQDGFSETLVCFDSRNRKPGSRDLIDKELGTLIWSVTNGKNVHFLAVMDCCHSGSNTRDVEIVARQAPVSDYVPRSISEFYGISSWDNKMQPPAAKHIHLAAALDRQTAKELTIDGKRRGAFTFHLIKTLETFGGTINYEELMTVIAQNVKNTVNDQTPQCHAYGDGSDTRQTFLGSAVKKGEFIISHDKIEGWIINAGGIQGVPTSGASFSLKDDGRVIPTVVVKPNFSTVGSLNNELTDKVFRATLNTVGERSLTLKKLKICLSNDSNTEGVKILKKSFAESPSEILELVENQSDTNYIVRVWDGGYRLTHRNSTMPLFKIVKGYTDGNAALFLEKIETVALWLRKKELENALTKIRDDEFEVIFWDGDGNEYPKPYVLAQPSVEEAATLQMGIKNVSNRSFWVSGVYFASDFQVTNMFLPKKEIKPNEIAWVEYENSRALPFAIQEAYQSWGVYEVEEHFKFFISTDPIDTSVHNQDALELDVRTRETTRGGLGGGKKMPTVDQHDWRTILVSFKTICPPAKTKHTAGRSVLNAADSAIEIELPQGFSADIALTTSAPATATRSLLGEKSDSNLPKAPQILRGGEFVEKATFGETDFDVLELQNISGTLSVDKPLKIKLLNANADEAVIPFGYDETEGIYFPIGEMDADNTLLIKNLPPESVATEAQNTRSLLPNMTKAVKIYLQKAFNPFTKDYDYPKLRMAIFPHADSDFFEYEEDEKHIQHALKDAKRVALLLHGIIGTTAEIPLAVHRAVNLNGNQKNYDVVLTFDYETLNTTIEKTASDLKERLEKIGISTENTEGVRFDIVAHSMGGLVSRYLIERLEGNKFVSNLVLFGTPNSGSEISDLRVMVTNMLTLTVNGAIFLKPYVAPLMFLGNMLNRLFVTLDELNPKSDFIRSLNDAPDANVPYFVFAGNTEMFAEKDPKQYKFYQKIINTIKKRGIYAAADWWFDEPNDFAVRVKSVKTLGNQSRVRFEELASDHFCFFIPQSEAIKAIAEVLS